MHKLMILLAALLFAPLSMAAPDPYTEVKQATDILLKKLKQVQPLFDSDRAKFYQEIDVALAPFIDFDGFSRGVMAKYYRQASDAQKAQFVQTFRKGLVETYAKALVGFDNQKVVVVQPSQPSERPDRADISLSVEAKDGTIYTVDYNLALEDNSWKLRNVVINGINIGLQFRSQFASSMRSHGNNIDAVIANWTVDA